jgi:hypothetical protein
VPGENRKRRQELSMHAEQTVEAPQLQLPPDLVAEVSRRKRVKHDFLVEGWKPTLLERLARLLGLV